MYLLPKVHKMKKSQEELKVDNTKKDATIQSMDAELHKLKLDLVQLQKSNEKLNTTADMNMQKLNQEVSISQAFREEKEGVEKKLVDSIATIKKLQEQVDAQNNELKKAEGSKNYYLDKISKLESGEIITQQAIDIIMNEFYASKA